MARRRRSKKTAYQTYPAAAFIMAAVLGVLLVAAGYVLLAQWATIKVPAAVIQSQIIALTNDERAQNSVGTLEENTLLDQAAQAKANDMAAKGYFSHTGPDGKTPWQWIAGSGYDYTYAGENLAVRFTDSSQVVEAWMASPTHRANMVKAQYQQVGVGVADGTYEGQPATFVVQYFGTPPDAPGKSAPQPAVAKASPAKAAAPAAASASAPAPVVAGAESDAAPASPAPTWWARIMLSIGSVFNSLTAAVAGAAPVDIGNDGASIVR